MVITQILDLRELADVAEDIGQQEGRDFSFKFELKGKQFPATVRYINENGEIFGDVIPARDYAIPALC